MFKRNDSPPVCDWCSNDAFYDNRWEDECNADQQLLCWDHRYLLDLNHRYVNCSVLQPMSLDDLMDVSNQVLVADITDQGQVKQHRRNDRNN